MLFEARLYFCGLPFQVLVGEGGRQGGQFPSLVPGLFVALIAHAGCKRRQPGGHGLLGGPANRVRQFGHAGFFRHELPGHLGQPARLLPLAVRDELLDLVGGPHGVAHYLAELATLRFELLSDPRVLLRQLARSPREDYGEDRNDDGGGHYWGQDLSVAPRPAVQSVGERGWTGADGPSRQEVLQVLRQRLGAFVALCLLLLDGLQKDDLDVAGQRRMQGGRLQGSGVAQELQHPQPVGVVDGVGRDADHKLIQDDAEGVDVRTAVHVLGSPEGLLRAHVAGGAHQFARHGQPRRDVLPLDGRAREPEVKHARAIQSVDHDVARLQVAVDDPMFVRVVDGVAHSHHQSAYFLPAELVLLHVREQVDALDELHREVGLTAGLAVLEYRHDGRVFEVGHRLRLAFKALAVLRGRERAAQHQLQRHIPRRAPLVGAIDRSHPPAAHKTQQVVLALEVGLHPLLVGHPDFGGLGLGAVEHCLRPPQPDLGGGSIGLLFPQVHGCATLRTDGLLLAERDGEFLVALLAVDAELRRMDGGRFGGRNGRRLTFGQRCGIGVHGEGLPTGHT